MVNPTDLDLGVRVEDRCNGFRGIVTRIRVDISGCVTAFVEAENDEQPMRDAEQVRFHVERLDVVEDDTEFATPCSLDGDVCCGDRVRDTTTGAAGVVSSVAYNLFNCTRLGVHPRSGDGDERPDLFPLDEPMAEVLSEGVVDAIDPDDGDDDGGDGDARSTGAVRETLDRPALR